jgi:hypothetical protein
MESSSDSESEKGDRFYSRSYGTDSKHRRIFDDDPLAYALRVYLETLRRDELLKTTKVLEIDIANIRRGEDHSIQRLREIISLNLLQGRRSRLENFLQVQPPPSINREDVFGPVAPDRNVALQLLTHSPVRIALELLKSITFLARFERDNSNQVWEDIFKTNFPEYVAVMTPEIITREKIGWRLITIWTEWAQKRVMRLIATKLSVGGAVEIDNMHFIINGKKVHVHAFAIMFGFYKGRLLSFERTDHFPRTDTFDDFMSVTTRRALFTNYTAGLLMDVGTREWRGSYLYGGFETLVNVCSEKVTLSTSRFFDMVNRHYPKDYHGNQANRGIFLGNQACAECGAAETKQWYSCTSCNARVCASQECERTHINEFH